MAMTKQDIYAEGKGLGARYHIGELGHIPENPYKAGSWQNRAWQSGWDSAVEQYAAKAAEDGRGPHPSDAHKHHRADAAFAEGIAAYERGEFRSECPYSENAHLASNWVNGYDSARNSRFSTQAAGNLPRDTACGVSSPFPARMPAPTRQHIITLEKQYGTERDGARLARLARKVDLLYIRYSN